MGQRLSAAGKLAGLTEPEIMALAASMSSVGIEAEAGGTAMTQTLTAMEKAVSTGGEKLAQFASVAGVSAERFAEKWQSSPIEAIQSFISGLSGLEAKGESATLILEEMGLSGVRQSNMLKSLGTASGLLTNAVEMANTAWEENTALQNEAATRYETTESKLQMFKNSVTALQVAVGDELNPALNALTEAGTGVLKFGADFVKQNEWAVPAIALVTSGLAALTVGAGAAAFATTQLFAALKAAALAALQNPVILAASAMIGLATAIGVAVAKAREANPELERLTKAAKELPEAVEGAETAYQNTVSGTEAAAQVAEGYISRLEQLEAAGINTTAQQEEYHRILVTLCETVPELTELIDLENDSILGGVSALRESTEAWKENAIAQAYQDKLTEAAKKYAEVQISAREAELGLADAQERKKEATKSLTAEQEHYNQLTRQMTALNEKALAGDKKAQEELGKLSEEYDKSEELISQYSDALSQATSDEADYTKALGINQKAMNEAKESMDGVEEAAGSLTKEMKEQSGAQKQAAKSAQDYKRAQEENAQAQEKMKELMGELAKEYKSAYDSAYQSISGQIGLFGTFFESVAGKSLSTEEMMEKWATQAENVGKYTENLKLAAQYGLDEGLIKSLSDGSEESVNALATIIQSIQDAGADSATEYDKMDKGAKKFVDDFNGRFKETEKAKDEYAGVMADMEVQTSETVAAMRKTVKEFDFEDFRGSLKKAFEGEGIEWSSVSGNIVAGISQGLKDNSKDVVLSAGELSDMTLSTFREKFGVHSPSTMTHEMGEFLTEGLREGIDAGEGGVLTRLKALTEKLKEELRRGGKKAVDAFDGEFRRLAGRASARLSELQNTVLAKTAGLTAPFYTLGQSLIDSMIDGINSREASLQSAVTAAAIAAAVGAVPVLGGSSKSGAEIQRELGINDTLPAMKQISIAGGTSSSVSYSFGDIRVELKADGKDGEAVYKEFKDRLTKEIQRKKRGDRVVV